MLLQRCSLSGIMAFVNRRSSVGLVSFILSIACFLTAFAATSFSSQAPLATAATTLTPGPKPPDASLEWKQLVGIYSENKISTIVLERDGQLLWKLPGETEGSKASDLERRMWIKQDGNLDAGASSAGVPMLLVPVRDAGGKVTELDSGPMSFKRTDAGNDPAHFYHVTPAKAVAELRVEALRDRPPKEVGPFRKPDLVELVSLDSAFHLDIRYAQANNFLSTPVYTQARAFLQRPAAEALDRVQTKLQPLGYGLLIHDAYRPWYVTKIFWDATPPEGKIFVADPKKGSKHNRGCAVDLTLYDLTTSQAIQMPGLYDEMSARSFPTFPGGTSLERWHRDLLRKAMESEGFTVDGNEWWHFDYRDWKQYPILNVPFEDLGIQAEPAAHE